MKLLFTRFCCLLGGLLGVSQLAQAQVTYTPVAVTGYTDDVIADGPGTVASRTTNTVDRGNATVKWCFANTTYVTPAGVSPAPALPANGLINSITTPGLSFQLAPATSNNSMRLNGAETRRLKLVTPRSATEVMVLATEGNGNTTGKTFTVKFTDSTSQVFTNAVVPDWFSTTPPAIIVGSRVGYVDNVIDYPTGNPRIYQVQLQLLQANYNKPIASIIASKTTTDPVLNVMGITLGATCQGVPTAGVAVAVPNVVCPGQQVALTPSGSTATGGISFQWQASTDGGVTFTNVAGAINATYIATPSVTTIYRVVLTCSGQAGTSTPVTVTVQPTTATLAYATPPATAAFCRSGTQAVIAATPAGGTFSAGAGLSLNATTGTLNLGASTAGTYTVTYTPATGACAGPATTTVTILPSLTPTLAYAGASFCAGAGTAVPTTSTPAGGTFSGSTGLVINAATGVVNLAQTPAGTYTISYTSAGACSATTTTPLTVLPAAAAALTYGGPSFCKAGAAPAAVATPAGGTFSSTPGLSLSPTTGAIDLAASSVGTYTVTYTPATGTCAGPTTTTVTVVAPVTPTLTYAATNFCAGVGTAAPTTLTPAGGTFSGSPGLVINANTGAVNLAQTPAGTYTVRYTSAGACSATATAPLAVLPAAAISLTYGGTDFCKAGAAPAAVATPAGGTFSSTPGLSISATTGAIDLATSANGTYTVTYTSTGQCGGQATARLSVKGNAAPVYPNVLTPNGDRLNDVLALQIADVQNYSLQVFSRWGRRVYEGHNATEGWNPTDSSPGTYYYLVEYTDCAGRSQSVRNWVEVVK
ncbi:MAG: gliding motility-associated C-terminal domain-containing protein [Cytophagaceae bacterium]|nr:MAG: gliding motility-associated C-terminal domain-containing protein [Cytophagaceae bacterium]